MAFVTVREVRNSFFSEAIETIDENLPNLHFVVFQLRDFLEHAQPYLQRHFDRGLSFKVKVKCTFRKEKQIQEAQHNK